MKVFLKDDFTIDNIDTEEITQDSVGYNILKVYVPEEVVEATDTFAVSYAALLPSSRKVGAFGMVYSSTDPAIETGYALFKATLHQSVVSYPGKVAISFQFVYGVDGNATLIKKNSAVIQFDVRKSVAVNNDILILDTDQTSTDVLESYKDLLETALNTYLTQVNAAATYAKLNNSSQEITASKINLGSIKYNTAYPSNNTNVKTEWYFNTLGSESYIHKDYYLPRLGDDTWSSRTSYKPFTQLNEDVRGNNSDNTTGLGAGINSSNGTKPDIQIIPACRYADGYTSKGYASFGIDPIVLFRPGFAFTPKGHINPLDNPNTWFGFETDSNDNTKKSVKIKTAEASLEVDSEGVKANESLVVTQADIADNLSTNDATKVLSAKQGMNLSSSISYLSSTKANVAGSGSQNFNVKKLTIYGDNSIGIDGAAIIQSTGGLSSYGSTGYFRAQSSSNQSNFTEYNEGSIYRRAQTGPSTSAGYSYTFPNKTGTFALTSDVSALQTQVNNLSSVQNVADIVATKSALDALTTTNFEEDDKVQVIADETHDGASTVYNWTGSAWQYVGAYGGNSYTKAQTDALLNGKADKSTTYTKTEIDTLLNTVLIEKYFESLAVDQLTITGYVTQEILNSIGARTQVKLRIYDSSNDLTFILAPNMTPENNFYNYKCTFNSPIDADGMIEIQGYISSDREYSFVLRNIKIYTEAEVNALLDAQFLTDAEMASLISEVFD